MATSITSLITELRHAYGDDLPEAEQALTPVQLNRSIQRGVVMVNRDFGTGYRVANNAVSPDLTTNDRETLLLTAMVILGEKGVPSPLRRLHLNRSLSFTTPNSPTPHALYRLHPPSEYGLGSNRMRDAVVLMLSWAIGDGSFPVFGAD